MREHVSGYCRQSLHVGVILLLGLGVTDTAGFAPRDHLAVDGDELHIRSDAHHGAVERHAAGRFWFSAQKRGAAL